MLHKPRIGFSTLCVLAGLANLCYSADAAAVHIRKTVYHGWPEALTVSNGKVEAVVIPAIGRVMQFRFAGEKDGPFWENRSLDGKNPDSQSAEWINFGGDK